MSKTFFPFCRTKLFIPLQKNNIVSPISMWPGDDVNGGLFELSQTSVSTLISLSAPRCALSTVITYIS